MANVDPGRSERGGGEVAKQDINVRRRPVILSMCREEGGNNWDLLPDRMPRWESSLWGRLAMFFSSRWDKNGVQSPAEQITELRRWAGGVCQPRGVP